MDVVKIVIKSGDGGDGMCSFQSYKGKPACGPDGGDGGKGGNVFILADENLGDLMPFRYKTKYKAGNGQRGGSSNCTGKSGEDVIISVPVGTVVKDYETGAVLGDMFEAGDKKLICSGGKGGKGNARFTTPKRHAPHFSQKGEKTGEHSLVLELKVIADVGIIGFPNVGKSTVLSKISAARPKIANYHFTTLSPNLGVVPVYDESFVAADIPGLIEGASEGSGLGHDFLRHIERTRMLLHVIDISGIEGRDPVDDFKKINDELKNYSEKLAALPQIILLNKCDIPSSEENIKAFKKKYGKKYEIFLSSANEGKGLDELKVAILEMLKTLPPVLKYEEDETFTYKKENSLEFEIFLDEGDYIIEGPLVDMLERNVNLRDADSFGYFQKILKISGASDKLEEMGIKEGDTVIIGDVEFEYIP